MAEPQALGRMAYDQALPPVPGEFDDFNTEEYDLIEENSFQRAENNPLSTFSIDVDAASYSNLRRFLRNGEAPPKDAIRIEEMINYFTSFAMVKSVEPIALTSTFLASSWLSM